MFSFNSSRAMTRLIANSTVRGWRMEDFGYDEADCVILSNRLNRGNDPVAKVLIIAEGEKLVLKSEVAAETGVVKTEMVATSREEAKNMFRHINSLVTV